MQRHIDDNTNTVENKIADGVVEHDDKHAQKFSLLWKLSRTQLTMSGQVRQHSDSFYLNFFVLCRKQIVFERMEHFLPNCMTE